MSIHNKIIAKSEKLFSRIFPHHKITRIFNNSRLSSYKNIGRGKRAFIIGNGPSLRPSDLDLIASAGELSFASNKIFMIFPKTTWRPSFYAIEDTGVANAESEEIISSLNCPVFAADYLRKQFKHYKKVLYFKLLQRVEPPIFPEFALSLPDGVYCGGTITYSIMQLVSYMAFDAVYLLGVDFNYTLPNLKDSDAFHGLKTYEPANDLNYFSENYIKPGEVVVAPDLESSYCAYQKAQQMVEAGKIPPIYNATRGGKLEVFPRVDFDSLF